MVLESIVSPLAAERRPWEMFFVGMLYSSVAILLAMFVFDNHVSLVMTFFTVMAAAPIMYLTIRLEERKDLEIEDERILLKEHGRALSFFMFLFAGFVVSFTLWYTFLPGDLAQEVFRVQADTILAVNGPTGNAVNIVGTFMHIMGNNLRVLLFAIIFAFFYGVGAIFLLTWNASVIAVAVGEFARQHTGIALIPLAFLRYFLHGVPEVLAYFMGGLAGGIVAIAIIRHDFTAEKRKRILIDSADLLFGAVTLLVVAGLLEVFVSPYIG